MCKDIYHLCICHNIIYASVTSKQINCVENIEMMLYFKMVEFNAEVFEPHHEKTNVLVSDWSDTNQAVQLQKMARGLKFQI